MSVTTLMSAKQAAARASNRKGGTGVSGRYIREEIERGNLKAKLETPIAGKPFWVITEEDFLEWESKRAKSAPGE